MQIPEISVETLKQSLDENNRALLDVRTDEEHDTDHVAGMHIPLHQLMFKLDQLDKTKSWAIICRSGARSAQATTILMDAGFTDVVNVKGGFKAWKEKIDPTFVVE